VKRIKDEIIDELLAEQREGREVFGPDGIVTELTKRMMELLLQAELDDHLGYPAESEHSERRDEEAGQDGHG
jgi:transposase-like protein